MPAPDILSPKARQAVQPGMTPCQQAHTLNKQHLSTDAVKALAHGMAERYAVKWAAASAEKVANPAHLADTQAIQAAKAWVHDPSPANLQAAGTAAAKTDFHTPGAWAAQAAAWAGKGGGLTPHAVVGAVLLAAAQKGKPISLPGAPALKEPALPGAPAAPRFHLPFFKAPAAPTPEIPKLGPDGLTLTNVERIEMAKHCDPFLKLGCEIGSGHAS